MQAAPEVVQRVISSQLQRILGDQALPAYQARYLEQHSRTSLLHLAAAAEAGALLDPSQRDASAQLILSGAASALTSAAHGIAPCTAWHQSYLPSDGIVAVQARSRDS